MVGSIQTNASALRAFSNQMATSANNVANGLSTEFKAGRAINTETLQPGDGVTTTFSKDNSPGPLVEDPLKTDGSTVEMSNTDIATEMINQISAQHGFDANARAIQTQDETLGTVIDIMG